MRVHHITPGHSDKNYGLSINQLIENLPEDDWICLRDIDTLPLHHRVLFKQCEEIAERNEADLIGCMTNRIGIKHQQHDGMSNNFDIQHHTKIAHERFSEYGSEIEVIPNVITIAGVFMLFSKKTWLKVGKFREGAIQVDGSFIDYHFCQDAKKHDLKIAVAKGIYIFHTYRSWVLESRTKSTRTEYQHLLK